ncbi:sulfite exporter TauE/SafE family protein [Microcella pacifica]|uniref:Probable membrane transporter protein n=1 Tax=Microcella pacifica TaxID=2591847 RepID=A0A9E5JSH7_9MICO|nr:sulfite exporter TauE/SafE family protein [Microcella pacifica]NHF64121.1 sulfite exporter TauE/SafE family protein [Microcella pacifica]
MILPLLATGAMGGVLAGMFGVGGGIIMVPLLMLWARMDQRQAAATSLVAIVPTAVAGATTYGIAGEIDLVAAALVGAGAFAGAPLGAYLLRALPLAWLRWAFIVGMLIAAARLILVEPERGSDIDLSVLISLGLLLLGIVMGVAAGMFGIGGGVIAVPVLIALFGMGDLAAKGTSLAAMIPAAISGTIPNLRAGLVDVRQGLIVGIAAVLASQGGVALAFLVPPALSGILFGSLLVLVAGQLAIRAVRAGRRERRERDGDDRPTP